MAICCRAAGGRGVSTETMKKLMMNATWVGEIRKTDEDDVKAEERQEDTSLETLPVLQLGPNGGVDWLVVAVSVCSTWVGT